MNATGQNILDHPHSVPIDEEVLNNTSSTPIEQNIPSDVRWVAIDQDVPENVQSNVIGKAAADSSETRPNNCYYLPPSKPLQPVASCEVDIHNFNFFVGCLFLRLESWILEPINQILRDTHDEPTKADLGPCVLGNRCSRHICHVISKFEKMSVEEVRDQVKRVLELPWKSHGFKYLGSRGDDDGICAAISLPFTLAVLPNFPNTLFHRNLSCSASVRTLTFVPSGDTETIIRYECQICCTPRNHLEFILYILDTPWARFCF